MKLFHYSHEPNLDVIDPAHYGKNKSISPEYRQGTKHLVPRSYFYAERDEPEGVVAAGRHRYETELPQDFKTYDLRQDPEGIRSHVHKQTGLVGPGLSDEMEHEIARRGYHGYRPTDNVLISFKPIPVKKPNLLANERSFMSKNLKEKAFDALKKAAEYFITNPEALSKAEAPEKVDRVETPNKESEIFQETAAGIKNAPKEELKQPAPMKKDEAGKKADLVSVPTGNSAPAAAPKVNVPPKGSQIALKGRIKPESINKLKEAGYHPYFADDAKPKRPMLKEEIQKAGEDPRKMSGWKGSVRSMRPGQENETGVHELGYKGSSGGISFAGSALRDAVHSSGKQKASYKSTALKEHKKVLGELKAQPKPNLPKAELEKAKMDEGLGEKEKSKARFDRNKPLRHGSLKSRFVEGVHMPAYGDKHDQGTSNMGAHRNDQTRKWHSRSKLAESKAMGKPNLPKAELEKDDKPHPPGSAKDSAHDVTEEHSSIKKELQALSPEERQQMLQHLRTLKERINLRSDKNRKIGQD